MMKGENLISMKTAAKLVDSVDGEKPCAATVYRWARVGVYGHRLEVRRVGKRVATSREALDRFMQALASPVGTSV